MNIDDAIVHLRAGAWEKAHAIVQEDETPLGCWAHGIVHLMEGDRENARYWFERAGRPFPDAPDAAAETLALASAREGSASHGHGGPMRSGC